MTVKNDIVLWDNGIDKFCLLKAPNEQQYKYIDGIFEQYELEQLIPVTMELDEPIIEYDTTGANKPK